MKIGVMGVGYVGITTAACLAEMGNDVMAADLNESKVEKLQAGDVPFYEPGLDVLIKRNVEAGRLRFTSSPAHAAPNRDVIFIAVGTPTSISGGVDISYVMDAADQLVPHAAHDTVVAIKSTVPPGTCRQVRRRIEESGWTTAHVASNPEFLAEGKALDDFMRPDRVVIGTDSDRASTLLTRLYEPLVRSGSPIIRTDPGSAELGKYAANAMLAARISLMNEVASICEDRAADVGSVQSIVGSDRRIGRAFLHAGIGFGGSCFPKDVRALQDMAPDGLLLQAILDVNTLARNRLLEKVDAYFELNPPLIRRKAAVWGLAFKPGTDDIREAPAIHIVQGLLHRGVTVSVYDPQAMQTARLVLADRVHYARDPLLLRRGSRHAADPDRVARVPGAGPRQAARFDAGRADHLRRAQCVRSEPHAGCRLPLLLSIGRR